MSSQSNNTTGAAITATEVTYLSIQEYAKKVKEMRNTQIKYFRSSRNGMTHERQEALQLSKRTEAEVDKLTGTILSLEQPAQGSLF